MPKAFSDNPREATIVTQDDYMGIESGGVGLEFMKKVKVGTVLEGVNNKIDANKAEIEGKLEDLTDIVEANETDIEQKVTTLEQKVDSNEADIEQKFTSLQNTVNTNEADIEQKVSNLTTTVENNKTDIEGQLADLTDTVENNKQEIETALADLEQKVDINETDIEQKVSNLSTTVNANEVDIENKITTLTDEFVETKNQLENDINNTYTKQEVDNKFEAINERSILNKGEIQATSSNYSTICTQYIVSNYARQPVVNDALVVNLTDIGGYYIYRFSESDLWVRMGSSDANYTTATPQISGIAKLYDTLGNNNDGSVTQKVISSKINYYIDNSGKNILDLTNVVTGKTINSLGTFSNSGNNAQSTVNFIEVKENTQYTCSVNGKEKTFLVIAFYIDKNDTTYISRVTNQSQFTTPANCRYIRISDYNTNDVGFLNESQIEEGTVATSFEYHDSLCNKNVDYKYLKNLNIKPEDVSYDIKKSYNLYTIEDTVKKFGFYMPSGAWVDSDAITTIEYNYIGRDEILYFTGKPLGSAGYNVITFWDNIGNIITKVGMSSMTPVPYYRYKIIVPQNTAKITVSSYTFDGSPIILEKYSAKLKKNTPSVSGFLGHNRIQNFITDYCHIIMYGQSLSLGADSKFVKDDIVDNCYSLGDLTTPSAILKSLQITSGFQQPIVSTINCLHDLLVDNTNYNPSLIGGSYGEGATSIAQLMSTSRQLEIKAEMGYDYDINSSGQYDVFLDSLVKGKELSEQNNVSISCPVIIFLQGERDYFSDEELESLLGQPANSYACGGDKERYKLYMKRLKDDMQNECMIKYSQKFKPLFVIYQCSGAFVKNHEMSINMAQIEFAEENDDVILLPCPYFVPNYTTTVHLSTNGYRWLGEYIAKEIFKTLIQKSKYITMKIGDVAIEGNNIKVNVVNACKPIVIDTYTVEESENYGFSVWADSNEVIINSIKIYGDDIILQTNTNLEEAITVEVSYAGMENNGTGNIRDSSIYVSKYSYWDDTGDNGANGQLNISHRPTTKEGVSIIGLKYPMWEWLHSFYIKIK